MHASAYAFATGALEPADVTGRRVVEAGSYNYNGSVRGFCETMRPRLYTGTDVQAGPGVDLVCDTAKLPAELGEGTADVVITTEMLEHAEDWRAAMTGIAHVLAPGGLLVLTTRSAGFPYHPHPGDFWRFSVDHMDAICEALSLEVVTLRPDDDPASPGVFLKARKPDDWDGTGMAEGLALIEPGPPR